MPINFKRRPSFLEHLENYRDFIIFCAQIFNTPFFVFGLDGSKSELSTSSRVQTRPDRRWWRRKDHFRETSFDWRVREEVHRHVGC